MLIEGNKDVGSSRLQPQSHQRVKAEKKGVRWVASACGSCNRKECGGESRHKIGLHFICMIINDIKILSPSGQVAYHCWVA